ncbi:MAG: DUF962 domain-containing protein [Myxococcota bacterium]
MNDKRYQTFTDFWPFYLGEHSLPATRWMHFAGTTVALFNLLAAIATLRPWYVLTALVSGYAFAWVSHFFIEKNKPATFTYPLWSFAADWKMWAFMWTGKLGAELERHGIRPRAGGAGASAS